MESNKMDSSTHEHLLRTLSAMLIELNALQTIVDEEHTLDLDAMRDGLVTLEQMTREAIYTVRSTNDETLPELDGVTLAEALSRLVEETAEMLVLSSRVSFSGVDEQGRSKEHELSRAAERVLYLIAREVLYQVQQHSGTRKLRLALNYGQDDVQMSIEDDGKLTTVIEEVPIPAFAATGTQFLVPAVTEINGGERNERGVSNTSNPSTSYTDLRYRVEHLGGVLEINQHERGTRVMVRMPYTPHVDDGGEKQVIAPLQPAIALAAVQVVRILVVDAQAVTRAGLRRLLESYPSLVVVGEAADGVQAVSEILELSPQVVLMDAQLPNGQSLEALRQIKQLNLDTRVLLLSAQDREEYLYEALRAGADGYVLKDLTADELAQAIRVVARGETLVQPQLAGKLLSRFGKQGRGNAPYESLTARELEVLRLLARGLRNKEIASRLYVSERTVNFHLANIYQKLNVSGRTEALSRAIEQGIITA
ncbi:MAG: response regulator [Ktedonobacteraceae bacterium]|nr:response regulator [Ktedonobacteraceae bacterium]